ncbi:hypothetical protein IIA95_00660 [Patescibacteria group bacterium]|nr:hypothetical protein [Patescibacteria group bacterium]
MNIFKNKKLLQATSYKLQAQKGQAALITVLFFLFISLALVGGFSGFAAIELRSAKILEKSKQSYIFAEGALEDAIYRIKSGKNMPSEVVYQEGTLVATTTVSETTDTRDIEVEGLQVDARRNVRTLLVEWTGISFFYGAQVGEGGVAMGNNSRIEGAGGTAGNIYSNGPITGGSGATITGDATVATGIAEDNQARSTVCNQAQIVGQVNPEIDFAQSFQPSDTQPLAKVSLYIKKVGNPSNARVRITADSGGSPAGSDLANAILAESSVGSDYAWIDVVFSDPTTVTSGVTYWIVVDGKQNANKYWIWCKDSNQGYGNGVGKYSEDWDDDPWTQIVGDLTFKTFLGTGVSLMDGVVIHGDARANTITNSEICGDAYYQTIDASSLSFVNSPSSPTCSSPLTPGTAFPDQSDSSIQNMPISEGNIQDWKNDAELGGIINGNCGDDGVPECVIDDDGTLSLGPKRINGNLVLTKKQTLIVTGVLYFTGYIDMDSAGGVTVKCDASFEDKSCIILTDSWVHLQNNTMFHGSGEEGSYLMMLSTLDTCLGGTQRSECTHHNSAIDLHNNATGAIFYAGDSLIYIHNGVNVTEVTAYALRLDNTATVTYEEGLINSRFSSGPSGGWKIQEWQEIP